MGHVFANDPFGEPAPDGRRYFKVLPPPAGLIDGYETLVKASRTYQQAASRSVDPTLRALNRQRAKKIDAALLKLTQRMSAVGKRGATMADAEARANFKRTQVRPDTSARQHLVDLMESRPLTTVLPAGAIGIFDMDRLDRVPYWRVQEFGYTIPTDRLPVPGYFMPGGSPPRAAEFRHHAEFEQMQYAKGMPALLLKAGTRIPERSFLRDAAEAVFDWRHARFLSAQREVLSALSGL